MYFLKSLEETIKLHPSWFHSSAHDVVRRKLYTNVEGKNLGNHHVIAVVSIDDVSEPMIQSGSGFALYNVAYRALVWRPFRGEVVDAVVKSVLPAGCFLEVGGLDVFVSKSVSFFWDGITRRGEDGFYQGEGRVMLSGVLADCVDPR